MNRLSAGKASGALEASGARRFLSRVIAERIRMGLRAGALVAAATSGALLGLGLRAGTPAHPFNLAAAPLYGERAMGSWGFDPLVTVAGALLHAGTMLLLAITFAVLAGGLRGIRLILAAAIFAALLWLAHAYWPGSGGESPARTLSAAQLALVYAVLAVALILGMRLARIGERLE